MRRCSTYSTSRARSLHVQRGSMIQNVLRPSRRLHLAGRHLARAAQDSHHKSSKSQWESNSLASPADLALLKREDFKGIASKEQIFTIQSAHPEISFTKLQEYYQKNYRVQAETIFDVVLKLEADHESTINALKNSPNRWVPLLIGSCGLQMSNLDTKSRHRVMERLWIQLDRLEISIGIEAYTTKLRVLLENEINFDVEEELAQIQTIRGLVPSQETFRYLLKRVAALGDPAKCKDLVYRMANQGCIVDADCHASLVYCFAIRGHVHKAGSMTADARGKFDEDGWTLSQGALARAAAARGDMAQLRRLLRESVDGEMKLKIPADAIFDIIWTLAKRHEKDYGNSQSIQLIEEMLGRQTRQRGYYHYQGREVERHISQEYYYTAITLMQDMSRLTDILKNQQKSTFDRQVMSRLAKQMIRNKVPLATVKDVANRIDSFKQMTPLQIRHDLLYSVLTFRDFSMDERIDYMASLVDSVDCRRERMHLVLPLMASVPSVDDRLKILFRCSNLGYNSFEALDMPCLIQLLLQPLFDKQFNRVGTSKMDATAKILKSFGIPADSVWKMIHRWFKIREAQLERLPEEEREAADAAQEPRVYHMRGWLRSTYPKIFESTAADSQRSSPAVKPTFEKLKAIVESRDSAKAWTYVRQYGWPEDSRFKEIVPLFLEIVLEHEDWSTIRAFLQSLAGQTGQLEEDSAISNSDVLAILRLYAKDLEAADFSIKSLTEFCYELKRMFPHTSTSHQSFFDAQPELRKLINTIFQCLEKSDKMSVSGIDECIDLLRTLVKLDFVHIFATETHSSIVVANVLRTMGWDQAVNTWMNFQSGLNCSNGIVELLRYALQDWNREVSRVKIQYVIHKAQNFIPASRVHLLYVAVMVSMGRLEEAEKYFLQNKDSINSQDCFHVFKLWTVMHFRAKGESFMLDFTDLCLKHTDLVQNDGEVQLIKNESLRLCRLKNLASLALRLFDRFKSHSVQFGDKEKLQLWSLVQNHSALLDKWIFEPDGLLRIERDDPIVRETDTWRIENDLRAEIELLKAAGTTGTIVAE